jgi:hypothetical protein
LETSLNGAQHEIAAQLSIASSLEAKLSTLFTRQLLADLGQTIGANNGGISLRRSMLSGSLALAVAGPVAYGLAQAFF